MNSIEFQIVSSQKKKPQVIINDFIFTQNKENKQSIYFKCSQAQIEGCRASVSMDPQLTKVLKLTGDHSHDPDFKEVKQKLFNTKL